MGLIYEIKIWSMNLFSCLILSLVLTIEAASFQSATSDDLLPGWRRMGDNTFECKVKRDDDRIQRVAVRVVSIDDPHLRLEVSIGRQIKKDAPPVLIRQKGAFRVDSTSMGIIYEYLGDEDEVADLTLINGQVTEVLIATVMKELLLGLSFLHSQNIVHGGVAPSKILLNSAGQVKLLGYGQAIRIRKFVIHQSLNDFIESPEYLDGFTYDQKHDIWMLGMTAFYLQTGTSAYQAIKREDIRKDVTGKFQKSILPHLRVLLGRVSDELYDFVQSCLQVDPFKRPDAQALLKHPFLQRASNAVILAVMRDRRAIINRIADHCTVQPEECIFGRMIGSGHFGTVFNGQWGRHQVAIKRVPIVRTTRRLLLLADELTCMQTLTSVPSQYCLRYYGAVLRPMEVWTLSELIDGVDLEVMLQYNRVYEEPEIARICRDVLQALSHLHSLSILHRDVKPENIMLGLNGQIRLIDLGMACPLASDELSMQICCTPQFVAPELLERRGHNHSYDIWCLGGTAYCLLIGISPNEHIPDFYAECIEQGSMTKVYQEVAEPKVNECLTLYSEPMAQFIKSCLQIAPQDRPTAADLLKAEFLNRAADDVEMIKLAIFIKNLTFD